MSAVRPAPAAGPLAPEGTPPAPGDATPYRIGAAAFGRMLEAEVFPADSRVELRDGRICEKMARAQAHAAAGINVTMTLSRSLPPGWCLSPASPVALGPQATPLPDLAAPRGVGNSYLARRPAPADVGLLVEWAATSPRADAGSRPASYAQANIPAYRVLDLIDNLVLASERPAPAEGRYELAGIPAAGRSVPLRLDGVLVADIPAADLLPVRGQFAEPSIPQGTSQPCPAPPPPTRPRWKPAPRSSATPTPASRRRSPR